MSGIVNKPLLKGEDITQSKKKQIEENEKDKNVPDWAKQSTKPTYSASEVGAYTTTQVDTLLGNKADKIPVVDMTDVGTLETPVSINPNTYYVWGEIAALYISLVTPTDVNHYSEYMFEFISGSTATVLSLPSSVKFPDDYEIEANKKYQVSIVDNIGLIVRVDYE